MSTVENILNKFWLFRSKTNFSIFTLFFSGSAYFFIRYQNDQKLEHPVVYEAIRLLENHDQIVELIGYPIYVHSNARAKITTNDHVFNGTFMVRGPKGYLNLELAGQSKPQGYLRTKYEEWIKSLTEDNNNITTIAENDSKDL